MIMNELVNMEKYFIAAIGDAPGVGSKSIASLVKFFGSAPGAWFAETDDLIRSGVRKSAINALVAFRDKNPDAPEKIFDYCQRHKINLCSIFDEDYPILLKQIDSPPMFFYYRGQLQPHALRVGIVGSRDNTAYGQNVALDFGEQLAAAGLTVVSGAARGIDSYAHSGALKSGRTVAVLGCGIQSTLPRDREYLLAQIAENGCVISEFNPHLIAMPGTLAARNRIIAGLCRGVIVVEAAQKSGALITTNFAANYGRDLFAVPGRIVDGQSYGCNNLIRDGAVLINSAQDVLDKYHIHLRQV